MKLACPVLAHGMRAVSFFDAYHRQWCFLPDFSGMAFRGIVQKYFPIRDIQITSTLESIYRFTTKI
jgi:hypothetical protein